MKGYLEHLDKLGLKIEQEFVVDISLQSLPEVYDGFIMNFNMHSMDKTVSELHGMLNTAENNIKSNTKDVLMVKGKVYEKRLERARARLPKAFKV